jgi:hypothetical protein
MIALDERCNHRPINFRETAWRGVLTVGNINSDATGFDITHGNPETKFLPRRRVTAL